MFEIIDFDAHQKSCVRCTGARLCNEAPRIHQRARDAVLDTNRKMVRA